LSYAVASQYQPVSKDRALSVIWATTREESGTAIGAAFVAAIDEARAAAPSRDELDSDLEFMRQRQEHPFSRLGEAQWMAAQALLGAPPQSFAEILDEHAALNGDDVLATFVSVTKHALLIHPPYVPPPVEGFASLANPSPGFFPGRVFFDVRESPFTPRRPAFPRYVVSDVGLSVVDPTGVSARIPYDEVAIGLNRPDGLTLVHTTGVEITVSPGIVRDGASAVAAVSRRVPTDRVVQQDAQVPSPPIHRRRFYAISIWAWLIGGFESLLGLALAASPTTLPLAIPNPQLVAFGGLWMIPAGVLLPVFVLAAVRFKPWAWIAGALSGAASALAGVAIAVGAASVGAAFWPFVIGGAALWGQLRARSRHMVGSDLLAVVPDRLKVFYRRG
jgi:hypothetical protein